MRAFLDSLYRLSGVLAAVGMVATLVLVASGVLARPLGIYLPGTDDYAGYAMAACGFLALAYTFKHGEHIRVTLIIERLSGRARIVMEWLATAFGSAIACTLAFYSMRLVLNSHEFNDISQGVDATPLWIPQLGMAIGTVILAIAFLDDLLLMSLGKPVARLAKHRQEPGHLE